MLFVAAFAVGRGQAVSALATGVALGAAFALRGALRGLILRRVRESFLAATSEALVRGDVLRASPLASRSSELAVFEGLYFTDRVLSQTLPSFAGDLVASIALGALVAIGLPLRLIVIGGIALVCVAAAMVVARKLTARAVERAERAYEPVADALLASLGARLELAASGHASEFLADVRARASHWAAVAARSDRLGAFAGRAPVLAAALAVALAVVITEGLHAPLTGASLAQAAVFASVVPAFAGLARDALELTRSEAKLRPFAQLLASERAPAGGVVAPPPLPARVLWDAVSFSYTLPSGAKGPEAVSRVTVEWPARSVIVFTGPNGAGKSTCLKLLLALATPEAGTISIGGVDLFALDLDAWRRKIAYLPQRPFLPDRATVRDAIRLVARDASDETMRAALERVTLWKALVTKNAASPLDANVGALSVGQRQRLALARTLSQDAAIYLLDEPDANLDAAGIDLVAAIVRSLAQSHMVAVAAHTAQLVAAADHVVTLG